MHLPLHKVSTYFIAANINNSLTAAKYHQIMQEYIIIITTHNTFGKN